MSRLAFALALAAFTGCRQASREDVARGQAVTDSIVAAVHRSLRTGVKKETSEVFMESVVEERPELLTGPTLRYPAWLAEQGIEGRVVVPPNRFHAQAVEARSPGLLCWPVPLRTLQA